MDENNVFYRQMIPTPTTVSDDSCSFPSFPWFAENFKRRKSRLGTHRKQGRVLPDVSSNKERVQGSEEKIVSSPAAHFVSKPFEDLKNSTPSFANNSVDPKKISPLSVNENGIFIVPASLSSATAESTISGPVDSQLSFVKIFEDVKENTSPLASDLQNLKQCSPIELLENDAFASTPSLNVPDCKERMTINTSLTAAASFDGSKNNSVPFAIDTVDSKKGPNDNLIERDIPCLAQSLYKQKASSVRAIKTHLSCTAFTSRLDEYKNDVSATETVEKISPISRENAGINQSARVRPKVHFAEPLPIVEKCTLPQHNSKIPSRIAVNGKAYNVLNVLGTGGSSVVYEVRLPESRDSLAIKKVKLSKVDEDIANGYLNEVQMLESLQNCDVIIKILDHELVYEDGKRNLYVVMEKGDTDLSGLIRSVNAAKKLSIPMIVYYWSEMLAAVNEVHSRGIIHSDLKPANFLLVKGRLKLIDFGIASSMSADVTSVRKETLCGTLNYMSPEALKFDLGSVVYKITFKTDVWSLGCILYSLIYGQLPFQHIKEKWNKVNAIVSPTVDVEFPGKKGIPIVLMDSLKACLQKDPKKRPSISELLDRILRIYEGHSISTD